MKNNVPLRFSAFLVGKRRCWTEKEKKKIKKKEKNAL